MSSVSEGRCRLADRRQRPAFTAGGKTIADDGPTLRAFYRELLAGGAGQWGLKLYPLAGSAADSAACPPGPTRPDMAFAYIDLAGDDLVLLLAPSERGWAWSA